MTELHQDEAYMDPAFDHSYIRVMCWVALVDVGPASGCLYFVAGRSDTQGLSYHEAMCAFNCSSGVDTS